MAITGRISLKNLCVYVIDIQSTASEDPSEAACFQNFYTLK